MNSKVFSLLVVLISLFVLVLFTKDQIFLLQENMIQKEKYTQELADKTQENKTLSQLQEEFEKKTSSKEYQKAQKAGKVTYLQNKKNEIQKGKYTGKTKVGSEKNAYDLTEAEIIEYIYTNIERENSTRNQGKIIISSMNISKPRVNDLGLKELEVDLDLVVSSENRMINFLKFLQEDSSKYKFFIPSFSYPASSDLDPVDFEISVPLKIFYN